VNDNGVGLTSDLLPKVFDLFVQGEQGAERAGGGLGIGLALVRNLVAMHGGTVAAASAGPGTGSTFTVHLPVAPTSSPSAAQRRSGMTTPLPRAPAGRRVLVVDDNRDGLELIAELLATIGHEVRTAHDGPGALEVIKEFRPDVAILDIGLPVMDGYELAQKLAAELGPDTPRLIALTGYGQLHDRDRSRRAGFQSHLVKPVDVELLLRSLSVEGLPSDDD
jgi:CheY-like chemotaxis protein